MKAFPIFVLSLLISSWNAARADQEPPPLKVFVLAGQSNMVGKRSVIDALPAPLQSAREGVLYFHPSEGWQPLTPGKTEKSGFGPEISFAFEMQRRLGEPVGIIKHSIGGTNLHTQWNPEAPGSLYHQTLGLFRKAAEARAIQVAGLFWLQGGADAKRQEDAEAYAENYARFVDAWRRDLGNPDLAVVCGRCGTTTEPKQFRAKKPFIDLVRHAQDTLAYNRYRCLDLDDISLGPDAIHFDTAGMVETGRRGAVAMNELLRPEPASNPERLFRAGAATSNITPPLGSDLIGGFSPRGATHIHDELQVRCLVLDDGATQLAFAFVDNVQFPRKIHDAAKQQIHAATGIPPQNILTAATHTHSAPSLRGKSYTVLGEPIDDYQSFVITRITDCVRRAFNQLEPARVGWGSGEVPQHVFNRRWLLQDGETAKSPYGDDDTAVMNPGRYVSRLLEPAGPINPRVYFLSVESIQGRPIALLANYWLHYVGGVGKGHVSADYFGVFSERIAQLLGKPGQDPPFVGMLSNGASADINNNDYANYRNPARPRYERYEKMRLVAEDLAQEVIRVLPTIKHRNQIVLAAAQADVTLRYRRPTPEQVARAHTVLDNPEPDDRDYPRRAVFARRAIDAAEWPETVDAVVQTFRIGDLGIAALPFEVFAEIGLEIEARSPFPSTFVMELANGGLGYLPSPRQHELGGYETWLTVNRVQKDASPLLVDQLMALFEQTQN